jgi:hypothetical protein
MRHFFSLPVLSLCKKRPILLKKGNPPMASVLLYSVWMKDEFVSLCFMINPEIFTAETQRTLRKQNAIKNIYSLFSAFSAPLR